MNIWPIVRTVFRVHVIGIDHEEDLANKVIALHILSDLIVVFKIFGLQQCQKKIKPLDGYQVS